MTMKDKTSKPGISIVSLLLLLIAVVWLSGCSNEDPVVPIQKPESTVSFTMTVPDVTIPSITTRSMAGDGIANKEDEVQSIDLLVFDASASPEVFLEWMEGSSITQDLANNNSTVSFTAKLSRTDASTRIVVVANKSLSTLVADFEAGETTKLEVMQALTHSSTGKWAANGLIASGYTPIPMYGEAVVPKITSQMTPITGISLTRMLSRIDILNNAENFTVEEVYLTNYNTAGYVAPAWDSNGHIDDDIYEPMIPANSGKQTGATNVIPYVVNIANEGSYLGEIYTYEAPAAVDGDDDTDPSRKDAACLIVKGNISGGKSSYYRVDFMEPSSTVYMPLKRNYKYVIDIKGASGAGYESIAEAIEGYRTMTNLDVRLVAIDRNKITSIVYNGQYMLGVSEDKVTTRQYENAGYEITVFTDSPGGWKATIPTNSWLTFLVDETPVYETSGEANPDPDNETVMLLKIPYLNGATGTSRSETITLTAGRLTHEVTVTQTVEEPGTVKFVDEFGNVLENGLFFPMEDPTTGGDPEPQTFYVMWTSMGVKSWRQPRNEYNPGDTPMEYNSITPDIPATTANKMDLHNGVQAITLHPKRGTEDWRWDIVYFDLLDGDGVLAGHQLFRINQGALTFRITNYPTSVNSNTYQLELGPVHTLNLATNVNWEIESVEEIGTTGLLGTTGTQNISAGTSNMIRTANTPNVTTTIPMATGGAAHGTDIVASEARFNLNFPTGDWVAGKTGTVRVTFKAMMHTAGGNGNQDDVEIYQPGSSDDDYFPFYRTIDLVITAIDPFTYTITASDSYFGVNRERYTWDNNGVTSVSYISLEEAQKNCERLGTGWRIPNMSEALIASVYTENLGGLGADNPTGWFVGERYWTTAFNSTPGEQNPYRAVVIRGPGGTQKVNGTSLYQAGLRCVRDISNTGYPYVQAYSQNGDEGAVIVSRDGNGGVKDTNSEIFFTSTETVDETKNKIAPKLLVANTNLEPPNTGTYADAKTVCSNKGTGWRLPTQREVSLMMSVGMMQGEVTYSGTGFDRFTLPGTFTQIPNSNPIWTLNLKDATTGFISFGYDTLERGLAEPWWALARCVKAVN